MVRENANNQSSGSFSKAVDPEDIDLTLLWRSLWAGKWLTLFFAVVFSSCFSLYALLLPNMYSSKVLLAPVESFSGGGNILSGKLSGLASLAGVSLGGGGASKSSEALKILQSWSFIEAFIKEKSIAPEVYAAIDWDSSSNKIVYDDKLFDSKNQSWVGVELEEGPSSWLLYKAFLGFLEVKEDKNTGFVEVSVEYYSPELAADWAVSLVDSVNVKLKKRDFVQAKRNIEFLKTQIRETSLTNMQAVFYDLIEEQTKTLMLSQGAADYVFRKISVDPAPEKFSSPNRPIIISVGLLVGIFIGCFVSILRGIKV